MALSLLTSVLPKIIMTLKSDQNYYDLEKINVEWSDTLTTVSPRIITTSTK